MKKIAKMLAVCSGLSATFPLWADMEIVDGVLTHASLKDTTELVIPDGVVRIHEQALADCYDKITSVAIPPSVASIDSGAFAECDALTAVRISDLAAWCALKFQSDEDNPLSYARDLYLNGTLVEDLRIPGNVDKIGAYAFYGCTSITNVAIPNTVTRVGRYAFWSCGNLAGASLPPCLCSGGLNDGCVFRDVFGDSPLTHLSINEGVERIEDLQCPTVTRIDIPDTVVDIGDMAFEGCCSLESISIPSSVTNIGECAFIGCEALTSVHISDLVAWCVLGRSWRNPVDNPLYYARNLYLNGTLVEDLRIPEGVKEIGAYAFYGCTAVTNVVIPGSVTRMGEEAFGYCTNLTSATVPQCVCDPTSVGLEYYGSSMEFFRRCPLSHLKIAEGATSIGYEAFSSDTLAEVEIPNTVTNIGQEAFFYCPSLTRIEIPDSVEEIEDGAFEDCRALTNITIGTGLKRVGRLALETRCESTDIHIRDMAAWCGIEFPGGVKYNGLYLNGRLVEDLVIPDGVTEVSGAFCNYKRLVNVTVPASVTNFTDDAFCECTNLRSVTFLGDAPSHVEYMGTFGNVPYQNLIVYIPRGNATYEVDEEGRWHGMTVGYHGQAVEGGTITEAGDGGYIVDANDGESISAADISATAVVGGSIVDTSSAYEIVVADGGKSAAVTLKTPKFGAAVVENTGASRDEDDLLGMLVSVGEDRIAAKPTPKDGEAVGALPVATYPGLYYQAAWGGDLGNLTPGEKVQATGETLCLGVIKQTGTTGFYKVSVSEK